MKANALLAALLFLTPAASFAGTIWLHPPTKGIADPAPAKAWLESRSWQVNDPRESLEYEIPLTKALKLGLGVWYESIAKPKPLPPRDYTKPIPTKVDLDALSLVREKEKPGSLDSLADDPAFDALKARLETLEAELHGPLPQPPLGAE